MNSVTHATVQRPCMQVLKSVVRKNAVGTYEKPYEAAADTKEYLAFYPIRVDAIEVISCCNASV